MIRNNLILIIIDIFKGLKIMLHIKINIINSKFFLIIYKCFIRGILINIDIMILKINIIRKIK